MNRPGENSDRAEQALLGSIIRNPSCLDDVLPVVSRAEMFRVDSHMRVFQAIVDLHSRGSVSLVALADELHKRQQIKDIGGYNFLVELNRCEPTGAQAVYYANLVRDGWLFRSLGQIGHALVRESQIPSGPSAEVLANAERDLFALAEEGVTGDVTTLAAEVGAAYDRYDARWNRGESTCGLPSGIEALDDLTAGFQDGELIILAARPSVGKTALALWFARQITVLSRLPALFASIEQSRAELVDRMLCAHARVNSHQVRLGQCDKDGITRLMAAGPELKLAPLFIDDRPQQSALRISSQARRLKRQHDLRCVFVDYLQLIEPESRRESRHEQVGQIARRLKQLARDIKVPVIALAQLSRQAEDAEPRMSHLRESGDIEANADTIMFLHPVANVSNGMMELIVAKQRNGPTGRATIIADRPTFRFEVAVRTPDFPADYPGREPRSGV